MATQKAVQYLINHPKESLDASLLSSAQPSLGPLGHFAACRPQLAGFEPIITALLVSQSGTRVTHRLLIRLVGIEIGRLGYDARIPGAGFCRMTSSNTCVRWTQSFDGFRPYTPAESSVQTLARAISGSRLAACLPMAAAASSDRPRDQLPSG
jgi:hypothetical protein